ncbi:6-O-methylguanine DNA methyltransferase [Apodospora peruviana]|uniref:Methylated-DNA--protein-cysteine methyltransferase n=1 Tax=Apodospora peruviana TaxID=516989 RepID=A0AAE0HZA5_9PEZI|nr:6-O-methylguanine DNA methyltransferase [Apodospora peruviana]
MFSRLPTWSLSTRTRSSPAAIPTNFQFTSSPTKESQTKMKMDPTTTSTSNTKPVVITGSNLNFSLEKSNHDLNKIISSLESVVESLPGHIQQPTNRRQITPFDRKVYTLLLQIPAGSYTTYGLLAGALSSSPRAVGNSLRRNPYAPQVPCHRVVATGGAIGGFKGQVLPNHPRSRSRSYKVPVVMGSTEKAIETINEKMKLLRKEGVRFDLKGGKVLGTPFRRFSVA